MVQFETVWPLVLFKGQKTTKPTNGALLQKILTLHHPRIICFFFSFFFFVLHTMGLLYEADSRVWLVCVFLFLLFFLEKKKQKTKRLAATGMHWTSAEKDSSPWMHRRWLNQQSKAWKEEEGEEGGRKKGRRWWCLWELSLPTVQLIEIGLGFCFQASASSCSICVAYSAFGKENKKKKKKNKN